MDHDIHFTRYRREHAQRLDAEYREWLAQRRGQPDAANTAPDHAPRGEGPLESLGRAVSESVRGAIPADGSPTHAARGRS